MDDFAVNPKRPKNDLNPIPVYYVEWDDPKARTGRRGRQFHDKGKAARVLADMRAAGKNPTGSVDYCAGGFTL